MILPETTTLSGKESESRRIESGEFNSGVRGTELPIDFAANGVAVKGPGANLAGEGVEIGQRLSESLAGDRIKFPVFSIFQWNSHIHICNCAYGYSAGNFCIQENLRTFLSDCSIMSNITYTNYSAEPTYSKRR